MEITIAVSVLAVVISTISFALNRKDKTKEEVKEEAGEQRLIEYRLDELDRKVDKILEKLEVQEIETKKIVEEEMEKHILKYHKETK